MQPISGRKTRRMRGFTLIEIMVVVVIVGLLASIVGPAVMRQFDRAQIAKAEADLRGLNDGLKLFYLEHHRYPTEEEGLQILTGEASGASDIDAANLGALIEELPKDPWGQDYMYLFPGENGRRYDILTYGADREEGGGEDGGDDPTGDISIWSING